MAEQIALDDLLRVIVELGRELPNGVLESLIGALESSNEVRETGQNLARFAATHAMKEKLQQLEIGRVLVPAVDGKAIAFALRAAAQTAATVGAERDVEIAWTGPATESVPVRRVDQVVYEMVESARQEVLLVTYAAYKAERAVEALRDATGRGVQVKLVIELAQESAGKISFDGLQAFRAAIPLAQIFYWPLERRSREKSGSHGSMHAKCLVADRSKAFVSSANLTDHALEVNMELGVVIGRYLAARLADHFKQLIARRELVPAPER